MNQPTHADILAEGKATRALLERHAEAEEARLANIEGTQREIVAAQRDIVTVQRDLVKVATQGTTTVKVFLWIGGFIGGLAALGIAAASVFKD